MHKKSRRVTPTQGGFYLGAGTGRLLWRRLRQAQLLRMRFEGAAHGLGGRAVLSRGQLLQQRCRGWLEDEQFADFA